MISEVQMKLEGESGTLQGRAHDTTHGLFSLPHKLAFDALEKAVREK